MKGCWEVKMVAAAAAVVVGGGAAAARWIPQYLKQITRTHPKQTMTILMSQPMLISLRQVFG
jgi:hypothetical protein